MEIRSWFNGPAFLTWSRGQNEYGNNIAGPLPRSFMKNQWNLQRQILNRTRSLGIIGQLPGFQGNVPVQLIERSQDSNITAAAGTGWMNSVDPLYANISDTWMKTLINDFGTDHWYQLDGYFNGYVVFECGSHLKSNVTSALEQHTHTGVLHLGFKMMMMKSVVRIKTTICLGS